MSRNTRMSEVCRNYSEMPASQAVVRFQDECQHPNLAETGRSRCRSISIWSGAENKKWNDSFHEMKGPEKRCWTMHSHPEGARALQLVNGSGEPE